MSLVRAYVNCLHCHELGQIPTDSSEDKLYQLQVKENQHQARIEAIRELEEGNGYHHVEDTNQIVFDPNTSKHIQTNTPFKLQREGLNVCLTCDFTKPSLAQYLKSNTKTINFILEEDRSTEKPHNYRTNAKTE